MLKDGIAELTTIRDQARADAERREASVERLGTTVTPSIPTSFAAEARRRMRTDAGGYRRDHLRALAPRREIGGIWRSQFYTEMASRRGFKPRCRRERNVYPSIRV